MRVLGLVFVGTRTDDRGPMAHFVGEVLGLTRATGHGFDADVFSLPDGSSFAVTSPDGPGDRQRTVGFLVDDVDAALAEIRAAGIAADDAVSEGGGQRYVHFRAPDGRLYELVQRL